MTCSMNGNSRWNLCTINTTRKSMSNEYELLVYFSFCILGSALYFLEDSC